MLLGRGCILKEVLLLLLLHQPRCMLLQFRCYLLLLFRALSTHCHEKDVGAKESWRLPSHT